MERTIVFTCKNNKKNKSFQSKCLSLLAVLLSVFLFITSDYPFGIFRTIMRGRDYGLPDYNTVRKAVGLKPVTTWAEINIELNKTNPEVYLAQEYIFRN
jgi:hypothetical protein